MKRLIVLFVLLSPLSEAQVTPSHHGGSQPLSSTRVFLLPVGSDACWQEFAFLSAVPASRKASRGAPSVIALDGFGLITDEVRDYLARLGPYRTYLVGNEAEFSTGHWQLDEGSGGTAKDSSGNGYDGVIHGASWLGGSLEFDGIDDHVDITGYQGITGAGARSVAAWIKTTNTSCEILSWGQYGIPGGCWVMGIDDRGMVRLYVGDAFVVGKTKVNDGAWHPVALCLDDDVLPHIGNVELFVDGQPEGIGEIWDGASGTLKNSLVGYWQMNEGSGTEIHDSSSGGSTGTFHTDFSAGGDYPDWGPGLLDTGLYFDNYAHIEIDNEAYFDGTASAFTVSCWVKHYWDWGVHPHDKFITKGSQYQGGWVTGRPDDSTYISVNAAGQTVETHAAMQKDVWHHVVGIYDGDMLSIHVNGEEEDKKSIGSIGNNNVPLRIGCGADLDGNPSNGPGSGGYKGWIDEVAVWERDLTDNEIDTLYNNGAGMVIDTTSTPIDTQAADTVKIGVFNATQGFFQGSLEDVRIYDRALTAAEVLSLKERRQQEYTGLTPLPGASLDDIACSLADTFWHEANYVVLCEKNDYPRALSASVLASRLRAPLLYFDDVEGLSANALATVGGLTPNLALLVGQNSFVVNQLMGVGISTTTLLDAQEVLGWMINNHSMEVDYLALVNPNDRGMGRVPKSSLAGALLAAGRKGAVVPLAYDTEWKHPFWYDGVLTRQPDGAPDSITGLWYTGSFCLKTATYDFVISAVYDPNHYTHLNIDFNGDGDYGDPGEGPYESADVVEIEGTRYALSVGASESVTPGNIKFTYPCADEVKEYLAPFYATLGRFPEYLCVVGLPEAVPFGLVNGCYAYADSEDLPTDSVFGNVDDDLFIEIAVGRVFGENLCYATLLASRSLTYNALIHNPDTWAKRCMWVGEFWDQMHVMPRKLENAGFYPAVINSYTPGYDKSLLSVVIQDDHGGPGGIGGGWGTNLETLLAPCVVEAGGCDSAGIDMTTLDQTGSGQLLKKGAVAYIGTQRGTPEDKRVYRQVMWNAVLEGATLGQAHRRGLNAMWVGYLDEVQPPVYMHYCLHSEAFYGDPALKIYIPSEPILAPARTEISGTTFSAVAPELFWIDQITGGSYAGYYHNGPGMHPDYDQNIQFFFAEWKTNQPVIAMTQDPSVPSPLGWTGKWFVDEHPDGTFSVYTRVRFTQFSKATGQITKEVDRVEFEVGF